MWTRIILDPKIKPQGRIAHIAYEYKSAEKSSVEKVSVLIYQEHVYIAIVKGSVAQDILKQLKENANAKDFYCHQSGNEVSFRTESIDELGIFLGFATNNTETYQMLEKLYDEVDSAINPNNNQSFNFDNSLIKANELLVDRYAQLNNAAVDQSRYSCKRNIDDADIQAVLACNETIEDPSRNKKIKIYN